MSKVRVVLPAAAALGWVTLLVGHQPGVLVAGFLVGCLATLAAVLDRLPSS